MSPSLTAPRPFHVTIKPRGPVCNLACDYCYYLEKVDLYPGSGFCMSDAVLEAFTRQYIEAQPGPEVVFGWQGGEPLLMGLDFFRQALALQKRHQRAGTRLVNTLQTNGTLLDDAWATFLRTHDFLVGLSLDGPRAMHDAYRRDRGEGGSFDRAMRGLGLLQGRGVAVNVLACVHAANADHPLDVYRFLRDEAGGRFIQFIPVVQREGAAGQGVEPEQYGRFLTTIFDEWLQHDVDRVSVQMFDAALAAWLGRPPGLCVFDPTCGSALALEHNGDLYACDHFVTPEHRLGNVLDTPLRDLVASETQQRFGRAKGEALPAECRRCPVRFACNGGCPKNRLSGGDTPGRNDLCAAYRRFFHHADRPLSALAGAILTRGTPSCYNPERARAGEGVPPARATAT